MKRRIDATGDELQFVVFRLGELEAAFGIAQVERILIHQPPEPWPEGPGFLAGRLSFEGTRVPLLDLRARAGQEPTVEAETRLMVLVPEPHPLAVVVDQVREVLRVDSRTILPPQPDRAGALAPAHAGRLERGDRCIVILNADRLLSEAERSALSEGRT